MKRIISEEDLRIVQLGARKIESPLMKFYSAPATAGKFISDQEKRSFYTDMEIIDACTQNQKKLPSVEKAGPRERVFFDPKKTRAAIVSCGGLCPGINDVIRGIVMSLYYRYGLTDVLGIKYGYQGFVPSYNHEVMQLSPDVVSTIHKQGGTILGSSRGQQDTSEIVNFLKENNIQMLFVIGGDGTLRAALEISQEIERRGLKIAIIGTPKTIDNDIMYIDESFGFETAFSEAVKAINSAHTEALGVYNGIGLVKVMGRSSGFIASYAALAMNDVDFVLIPEIAFQLNGENGFLKVLHQRLNERKHAVIVVAEGAGQELIFDKSQGKDASGNIRLHDIGFFLKSRIKDYFDKIKMRTNLKYIDPSYIIRSVPASAQDSVYGLRLAEYAVHAAMCGKTKMVVAKRHEKYVHLPMNLLTEGRKRIDPSKELWLSVIEATGQPIQFS